ncbi:hypothetical protein NPIL_277851 [Nephila pilipes]|uniref:Uncharacterized protein n=1 Tax=Nephila pilipes TaxID=299642 RepID=A0A8X6TS71_NEPPI|nr:hypothetical protein NPIL_277851 [Nephila pilipes]
MDNNLCVSYGIVSTAILNKRPEIVFFPVKELLHLGNSELFYARIQDDCNSIIAENNVVFEADLLFLCGGFQPLPASCTRSVKNETDLKLHNTIAMSANVHPHISLDVTLLLRAILCFAYSLIPVLLQFHLKILVKLLTLREY